MTSISSKNYSNNNNTNISNNINNNYKIKIDNQIKKLLDINYIIKWENKRLDTKKKNIDRILEKKHTIQGNIQDIENELKRLKKETKLKIKEKVNICKIITKNKQIFIKNKKAINRLNQLNKMEEEIKLYQENENKIISNNINLDLKKIKELPIELKRYIQEYFTYDTKIAILKYKYKLSTIINRFRPIMLSKIINIFFKTEIKKYIYTNEKNRFGEYYLFYNSIFENSITKLKRNNHDEKLFLKYIIMSFSDTDPHIYYELYKFIILLDKI